MGRLLRSSFALGLRMTSGPRKLLDPATLAEAVAEVAAAASAEGVHLALLGGYALHLYGSDRLTGDLDFVADKVPAGLRQTRHLDFGGDAVEAPNGTPVDVIVRDDDFRSLYEEALERAVPRSGQVVPVVAPEYLVAMKMVAGRAKDAADLEFLLAGGPADHAQTREIIRRQLGAYAAREFDSLVSEIAWRLSRSR